MRSRYIILEKSRPLSRRTRTRAPVQTADRGELPKLNIEELTPAHADGMRQRKDITAVAPVMQMSLIRPVSVSKVSVLGAGPTWGVHAVAADASHWTGEGVVVAVLDTGVDPSHSAFVGVELVHRNFTNAPDYDTHGHGTHCLGTILGRDVDGTRIGVARGVQKALVAKVLGPEGGGSDVIAEAVLWAVSQGADVLSMSIGIDFPGHVENLINEGVPTELASSMALQDYRYNVDLFSSLASHVSAQAAFGKMGVLVAAAGNESRREVSDDYVIAVNPPAAAKGFISVAALANDAEGYTIAGFSNTGARVCGPGVDVVSANLGGGLASMSGTSMAVPHVAGVAALWAQKLKSMGRIDRRVLEDRLIGTASDACVKDGFVPFDIGAGMVQCPP